MQAKLLTMLIELLIKKVLTAEKLNRFADKLLDLVEDHVEETEGKWDDIVFLPMCKAVRASFNIPDND